jgi:hypothetical protein
MASAQGIRAGAAFVELSLKDNRLRAGLQAASQRLKAFGAGVTAIGAKIAGFGSLLLAPLAATTKVFADMGDKLAKMSARTGISVEALSELAFAAEQSGADMETLETGIRKMQQTFVDAAGGGKAARDSLDLLALTVEDLARLSPDEQFKLIADRLSQIRDPALRTALAMELFGKSGTQLLPLMAGGAKGIEELQEQARKLGLTMSTEDAKAAEAFGDTLSNLWKVITRAVVAIGSALVPVLQDVAESITGVAVKVGEWIRRNAGLVVTVFKVTAAVIALGAGIAVVGTVISTLGTILGLAAGAFTVVSTVVGVLGTVLAALLSPIGLVIGAVAALAAFILKATGVGAQALSWLGDRFNGLRDTAVAAWQGIGDALAAGDIGLAAKILWLTLRMEFQKGINWIQARWLEFKGFFVEVFQSAVFAVARFLTDAWAGLQVAWVETTTFLANAWTNFTSGIQTGWNNTQSVIEKGWAHVLGLFDKDFDTKDVLRQIDMDVQQRNARVERNRQAAVAGREQERRRRRAEIEQERTDVQKGLDEQQAREQAERERKHQQTLREAEEELDAARKEWQDALAEAAQKRAEAEADAGPERLAPPGRLDMARLVQNVEVVSEVEKFVPADVKGTFFAQAVRGLGSDRLADRTAKGVEEIAANTRKMLLEARLGGLVFE